MSQIIVDSLEPEGDDIMYILPSKLNSAKFLASNTFDQATIKNCPTEKITSVGLLGIFNSLKPTAKINIFVSQPIAIMLPYDSKQIEANLKLVGFESIDSRDTSIEDLNGKNMPTISIVAKKPVSKRGDTQVVLEVKTTSYKNVPSYKTETKTKQYEEPEKKEYGSRKRYNVTSTTETKTYGDSNVTGGRKKYNYNEEPKDEGRKKYNVTTKTEVITTTTTTTNNEYQPRGHKSYSRRYNQEKNVPAEAEDANVQSRQKLTESMETTGYKPRGHKTYKRVEETTTTTTGEKPELGGGRYFRRQKITTTTGES